MTAALAGRRCVVLGGGGFVGTNLRLALVRAGAQVVGYGRTPRFAVDAGSWIQGDFADRDGLARAVAGASHVFHLLGAADPGQSNLDPGLDARTQVPASIALLEACRDAGVERLVFLSSGGTVYRPGLPLPIAEDAATDPISAYGIGKLAVEKYCRLFHHLHGLDSAVLRIANPYGPFQSPHRAQGFIAKLMHQAMRGQPIRIWGDGSAVRDFLFVDDVTDAILLAAQRPGGAEPVNIGSGVGRSLRAVIADVERVLGQPVAVAYETARAADTPANVLDIRRAAERLGWRPSRPWEEGLRITRDWLAAN
jgi:UDP-glucose 4-epimerase